MQQSDQMHLGQSLIPREKFFCTYMQFLCARVIGPLLSNYRETLGDFEERNLRSCTERPKDQIIQRVVNQLISYQRKSDILELIQQDLITQFIHL